MDCESQKSLRYEEYTVALVCAMSFEMSAVRYLLDQEHSRLPIKQGDSNLYVLGELSGHNVAIACLPGNQGKGSAASVATNMSRTFPSIKWRLLVGIGGGVPSDRNDIRLGDVVVSMPDGQYSGVVQYDLGRDTENDFKLKGSIWPPPTILRSAVEAMQSDHMVEQNKVNEFLSAMLRKGPRLSVFERPSSEQDVLFEPDYAHDPNQATCEKCDRSKMVNRHLRGSGVPKIHYGLIASGDRVMRSAAKRVAISRDIGDILCFEMEAAGLMTEFPCIVIRGISDYADSHKNDIWQHYAAAAAAGCAKELLSYLNPEIPAILPPVLKPKFDSSHGPGAQTTFHGHGVQHTSSRGFSVGQDLKFVLPEVDTMSISPNGTMPSDDLLDSFLLDLCETDPYNEKFRIEEDKGGLLKDCYVWILNDPQVQAWQSSKDTQLMWIKGDPGKGKTMLMIGLVNRLTGQLKDQESTALTYFFCQNTVPNLNNGVSVLRGLIWKLLWNHRFLRKYIPDEYSCKRKHGGKEILEGSNAFSTLKTMLSAMLRHLSLESVYLLVDALDECDKDSDRLIDWIAKDASDPDSKAKWLLSSRHTTKIEEIVRQEGQRQKLSLELNEAHVSQAVNLFIEHKVGDLAERKKYDPELRDEVETLLKEKSESTFLWVALVCKRLKSVPRRKTKSELQKFPSGLQPLYKRMMHQVESQEDDDREMCKNILRVTTIAYRPLTLEELVPITGLPENPIDDIRELVELCGSFLFLREKTIYFVHQSARDYLNASSEIFPGVRAEVHCGMVSQLLQAMSYTLRKDIYHLRVPGYLIEQVKLADPDPLAQVRYACAYWVRHICEIDSSLYSQVGLCNSGIIHRFLKKHFLHWLEALSLMRSMSTGVVMVGELENCLGGQSSTDSEFLAVVRDARRFILYNRSIIENAPLQVYVSALLFCPSESLVRQSFLNNIPSWILTKPPVPENWGSLRQTLEGHSGWVNSVAFSADGQVIASGSSDQTVRLWDAGTGELRQILEGHSGMVNSVAFSADGQVVASGSGDQMVRLWDAGTGELRQMLQGHSNWVNSVVFSADGQVIASGSGDRTVRLWDAGTGELRRTLQGHSGWVNSVAFSADGQVVASGSSDQTVRLWDAGTGELRRTLQGHSGMVNSVAFSADGQVTASGSSDQTVRLWDAGTGELRRTLQGHSDWVRSVAFSADGQVVASGSSDRIVRLWDTGTGELRQTLQGHSDWVRSVAFPADGQVVASGSNDRTVRLWDASTGELRQTLQGHSRWVNSVAFSADGQVIASGSGDLTVRLWDAGTGELRQTLQGHSGTVSSVAFSADDQVVASGSNDRTVRLWDTSTGELRQMLEGHSGTVNSVAFSADGQVIASGSSDQTVRLWDASTGELRQSLQGHSRWVNSVAFSADGQVIASGSGDQTVRLWDAGTGELRQTLQGHSKWVSSVAFSADGQVIASGSGDRTVRLWDAGTGKLRRTLQGHSKWVRSVVFSADGQVIASGSNDRTVRLWDTGTGELQQTLQGHFGWVRSAAFSADGQINPLNVCERWITSSGSRVVLLPEDRQVSVMAVWSGALVVGSRSGIVTIFNFRLGGEHTI